MVENITISELQDLFNQGNIKWFTQVQTGTINAIFGYATINEVDTPFRCNL